MEPVAVIGGGVAGMSCAVALAESGIQAMLVERSGRLGGHTADWYRLAPDFASADEIVARLEERIAALGVEVLLNTEAVGWSRNRVTLPTGEELACSGVVVCTGFDLFDARRKEEYGYGLYRGVVTTVEIEKLLRSGQAVAILPQKPTIALLHCVGSRDLGVDSPHCSRMCCITAVKQAIELRGLFPEAEIYDFYMDIRSFGAGYEELYYSAQIDHGINFIRGRISEAASAPDGRISIKAEDTLLGRPLRLRVDLLILAVGTSATFNRSTMHGLDDGEVLYAGAAVSPKSVEESINDGVAKAHRILYRLHGNGG